MLQPGLDSDADKVHTSLKLHLLLLILPHSDMSGIPHGDVTMMLSSSLTSLNLEP